jgi:hypothetical protein
VQGREEAIQYSLSLLLLLLLLLLVVVVGSRDLRIASHHWQGSRMGIQAPALHMDCPYQALEGIHTAAHTAAAADTSDLALLLLLLLRVGSHDDCTAAFHMHCERCCSH